MASVSFFVFCSLAIFIQIITAQSVYTLPDDLAFLNSPLGFAELAANSRNYGSNSCNTYNSLTSAYGFAVPTNAGGFTVTSSSPISPTGIAITSENLIEGPLAVIGELPFLSAAIFEGELLTEGIAGVNYGCKPYGILSEINPAHGTLSAAKHVSGSCYIAPTCNSAGLTLQGFGFNGLHL